VLPDYFGEHQMISLTQAKYGGMEAADIKKIKDLEEENRRLKQMFADLSLECRALKDVIEKKL